jgi:ribose 5-phosphate isomerase B
MASPTQLTVAIASDHAGFVYKEAIIAHLRAQGRTVRDFGTFSPEACDYPVFIRPCAEAVARGEYDRGIVLGGSGNGEAIVANKVRGIRCGLVFSEDTARWTREHNNANCIAIGERTIPLELALRLVDLFLETPFDRGGRHERRVSLIEPA